MIGWSNASGMTGSIELNVKNYSTSTSWSSLTGSKNEIAILSDTNFNTFYIQNELIDNPENGDIVILTSFQSLIKLDVLKDNNLFLYLSTVYQYENNLWVNKECRVWNGQEWKELVPWLFNEGNQCIEYTGGWKINTAVKVPSFDGTVTNASRYGAINTVLHVQGNTSTSWAGCYISTQQKIDLSNTSYIGFHICTATTLAVCDECRCFISPTETGTLIQSAVAKFGAIGDFIIDVKALKDSYFIYFLAGRNGSSGYTGNYEVDKVWMYN